MAQALLHEQLLGMMELGRRDRHKLPEAGGDVGQEAAARQMKVSSRNLACPDQPGQYRIQLDDAKSELK